MDILTEVEVGKSSLIRGIMESVVTAKNGVRKKVTPLEMKVEILIGGEKV